MLVVGEGASNEHHMEVMPVSIIHRVDAMKLADWTVLKGEMQTCLFLHWRDAH